ncbi:MAG: DUF1684 domain-containing protein [Bacteroidales bacterium]|nr:DUF1684 domain-containing protein [Bacteroidales bacterium]MCF8392241.1 DUF1684 domain-containing protein [Bacteroidales bacterium]
MKTPIQLIILTTLILSCNRQAATSPEYIEEIETWQKNRVERLKSENGWLNVVGLYWLEEGENSFGSASDNTIIFPENAPEYAGIISKTGDTVKIKVNLAAGITTDGQLMNDMVLQTDKSGSPTIMKAGSFAWFIIKREDRFAIRLRDFSNPRIAKLDSIPAFPVSMDWVKEARFNAFDSIKKVEVPNMIGGNEVYECPGKLMFRHEKRNYELLAFKEGDGFFIILGDETSAIETYAAGRYMYTKAPDENGIVILDFNKAYNPPCAFTDFATCPLPPPENRLNIAITAGEKAVHLD